MIITKQARTIEALGIFCCGLILFTAGLSQQEIIGFEARFFLFAKEMWGNGPGWFPTTYNNPYPDYPVTSTLLIYGFSKLVGHLSKFTAIFPSAVASAITLAVTYLIGSLQSRQWGLLAVFFLLLTNTFVMEARTISPDQYVAMATTVCFYLVYSATELRETKRLWWIPVFFAVGFACRGPIGLVVPAGVVCLYYLFDRNYKCFFIMSFTAAIVLMLGCLALFAAAYHVGGMSFVQEVMRMEVSGRMQDAYLPWYFYFIESIGAYAITYPLAILVVAGLWREIFVKFPTKDFALLQKLIIWALVILIGLTVPAGKKIRYILAFAPALALLSAYLFMTFSQNKFISYLRNIVYAFIFIIPSLCLLAAGTVLLIATKNISSMNVIFASGMAASLPLVMFLCFVMQSAIIVYRKQVLVVVAGAALAFVVSYISIIEPINLALNHTRTFVEAVELSRHVKDAKLIFYKESPDGLPIKYVVNMLHEELPLFVSKPNDLLNYQHAFFVTDATYYQQLPEMLRKKFTIIFTGNLGHTPVVVFEQKS